jgi:hypothetical protein
LKALIAVAVLPFVYFLIGLVGLWVWWRATGSSDSRANDVFVALLGIFGCLAVPAWVVLGLASHPKRIQEFLAEQEDAADPS